MVPEEKAVLVEVASGSKDAVEVGCFMGSSAEVLLSSISGHLWTIDTFASSSGGSEVERIPQKAQINEVLFRLNKYKDRRTIIIGQSELQRFAPNSVDLVFLDGAHDYESVKRDIVQWLPVLKPGGIMCGHDYDCPSEDISPHELVSLSLQDDYEGFHYGVIRAVDEAFPTGVKFRNRIWWTEI